MIRRVAAGLLGALNALNGIFMLTDAERWFGITPGAVSTGPFNPHFVQDVGVAFIAAGLGLLARGWRTRDWPAAATGCVFLICTRCFMSWITRGIPTTRYPHYGSRYWPAWLCGLRYL